MKDKFAKIEHDYQKSLHIPPALFEKVMPSEILSNKVNFELSG